MSKAGSFSSVTVPMGGSGASSFDIILEKCHELVSDRVSDALTKMFDEADEALTAFGSLSRDPETSKLYEVTRNAILLQREAIVTQFQMRFLREFRERVNRVKKIGDQFAEIDLSSLGPVAEDDLDESMKFDAMASKLRQFCEEELLALDQRVGVLVGDADLRSEDNPFTPQAIVDAYKQTCRQINSNVDVRMVLLKLFDDHVLDEIRGVYKAVSALLVKNSILPKIRFSVERGKDGAKAPSGEPGPVQQTPGNMSGAPVTDNPLQQPKNTNKGSGMNQMSKVFDELFNDPKIPAAVKKLIGRLQTPMLKRVIADKSFFFARKSDPARQMLDELRELSTGLPARINESDPIYEKLESIIQSLIEGFLHDSEVSENLLGRFDELIPEANGLVEETTQSSAMQVDQGKKLSFAKSLAEKEIMARVHGIAVPAPIVEFLAQQWGKVLVVTLVKEGEKSEAWKDALETVDLLVCSGKRKETVDERRKMIAGLPALLKRIAAGLSNAGIDDKIRVQFFSELRKLHAASVGRSAQPNVEAPGQGSVIDNGSETGETDVASGTSETVDETETSDTVPDPEAIATIAEADEAETSGTAEQPDAQPMQDESPKADNGKEMQLDFLPVEGETAATLELADMDAPKTATSGEKSATTKSLPAGTKQAAEQKLTKSTTRTYDEPSAQLCAEMDKAMDATRTMFSDVDRFIMLGQIQNAINVLDSRIKREPSERDSWIKLMAICRDEGMEHDFYRTYAAFREQFDESHGS